MFTGIIEETGTIRALRPGHQGATISIAAKKVLDGLNLGDSVAVNGVCLTAVHIGSGSFSCDLSAETLQKSSFGKARIGTAVNLERPLAIGARLGGHFVQGHVDGMGALVSATPSGEGTVMEFEFPPELERYLVSKGSITVDGISLTVASIKEKSFAVAVIPHTVQATNLRHLKIGDPVNLEADILGKYFERFFQLGIAQGKASGLTEEYLRNQGF